MWEQMGQKRAPLTSTALSAILIPRVALSAKLLGPLWVMLVQGEQGQNLVPKQEGLSYQRHQCDSESLSMHQC